MPPKQLYKFGKLNMQTIQNLKNAQIYFNTPASFNDPFDCSTLGVSSKLTDDNIVYFYEDYMQKNHTSLKVDSIKDVPGDFITQFCPAFEKTLQKTQDRWLNETGCTCFSEIKDNVLMWSHYADGHKGICLEFDFSFAPFNKAKKVVYSIDFPTSQLNLFEYNANPGNDTLKPLFTKYKGWSYEREWRVFNKKPNTSERYDVDALKAVYFGCSVNDTDLEGICLILQGQSKNIKFYRAHKDKSSYSSYSLNFEEFTCTPHLKTT